MLVSAVLAAFMLFLAISVQAQSRGGSGGGGQRGGEVKDPGPREGNVGAGDFFAGLSAAQLAQAVDGQGRFGETENFGGGLGPMYNSGPTGACLECHSQPAPGGSSPNVNAYPYIGPNPQATADYNAAGATNYIPSFITANGPVREARFVKFANGTPDGGVHDLFTVTGSSGASTCTLAQPNFAQAIEQGNITYRIPLPVYGDGLIENIDDATILANQAANAAAKQALGISGFPNRNGNTGTISRFGWKAQNTSLLLFAGEAYSVEVGVSNELFGIKRPEPGNILPAGCKITATPDDISNPQLSGPPVNSDITAFAAFMRMLAPPTPATPTPSAIQGQQMFNLVGCVMCHTQTLMTAQSTEAAALNSVPANLFSDLLVHNMGQGLADGVTQGQADGFHFRTTPLWGVGQRVFFLHDGRTSDLMQAILAHQSQGSEANQVIHNFNRLQPFEQQAILDFLRSL
ncbi:MAG: di-heme oxidoredictase family protein [Candidatus Acidiferrales bacterium]